MVRALNNIRNIELKKIGRWILLILWFIEMVFNVLLLLVYLAEIISSPYFEYYGYPQWQWFYHNPLTLVRYALILSVITSVLMDYAIRWRNRNLLIALAIGIIPFLIIYVERMLTNTNI